MSAHKVMLLVLVVVALLLLTGCATDPEVLAERQAMEDEIAAILGEPPDPETYGEPKRCLTDRESRDFYALDDRRIVFAGYRDRMYLNTLIGRCPDLRWGDSLWVRSVTWSRICEMDKFVVTDWFEWPWYSRYPWRWGSTWGTTVPCTLGKFQPVSQQQIDAIKDVLDRR